MRVIDEITKKGLPCTMLTPEQMRAATGKTAATIIELLAKESLHASKIATHLNLPEQNVHYHVKKLREAGILTIERMSDTTGGTAKMLKLTTPSFSLAYKEPKPLTMKPGNELLEPFIQNGQWNAKIVTSSPDPHGPENIRGRDTQFAVDIAMFFGSFLESPPEDPLVLDTELRDWDQNLVIIGGPVVNKVAEKINSHSPLPYDIETKTFTGKTVYDQENVGIIVSMENPYAKGKRILLVAGKRYAGTRGAILAFLRNFQTILKKKATVVLGKDTDSDGVIDEAEILE